MKTYRRVLVSICLTLAYCAPTIAQKAEPPSTVLIGDPALMARQNEEFTIRTKWFSNFEILRQATNGNAQLMALSGPRNPYPGKLGAVEEGACADVLLINGNPLEDISILTKPEESLALIMKDGKICENTIQ